MSDDAFLAVTDAVRIPRTELEYRASRSGGPGGQHVNTSSTRVELWWDVAGSPALNESQRNHLLQRLATRLDGSGRLRLVSGASRSQMQNKADVTKRLVEVVARALHVPKPRKKTRPSRASKAARADAKRRRAGLKESRRRVDRDD